LIETIDSQTLSDWSNDRATKKFIKDVEERKADAIAAMLSDEDILDQTQIIKAVSFHRGKISAFKEVLAIMEIVEDEVSEREGDRGIPASSEGNPGT